MSVKKTSTPTNDVLEWAEVYKKVGFNVLPCHQNSKNPSLNKWENFQYEDIPLETIVPHLGKGSNLGVTQYVVRYAIVDVDNIEKIHELAPIIDFDKKTLIANTNHGFHILCKVLNYNECYGAYIKLGFGEIRFKANTIVPPSEIDGVKRFWRYLSVNEAIKQYEDDWSGRPLTPEEFLTLVENEELLELDLARFEKRSEERAKPNKRVEAIKRKIAELNENFGFYREGVRHLTILHLSAMLRKSAYAFTKEEAEEILSVLYEGDEEKKDRLKAIETTYEKDLDEINYCDLYTVWKNAYGEQTARILYRELKRALFPNTNEPIEKKASQPSKLQRYFQEFLEEYEDVIYRDDDVLYLWEGRYFRMLHVKDFMKFFLGFVQEKLGEVTTPDVSNQVYYNLLASPRIKEIPSWKNVIAFENLVFDLDTLTFAPHSIQNGNRFFVRAKVIPELFYEAFRENSWLDKYKYIIERTRGFKKYVETLELDATTLQQIVEMCGYAMLPRRREHNLEVAFVLYGKGANGKSTLLALIQKLFEKFYSSVSLSDLEGFSLSSLLNSYLNIANEITEKHDKMIAVENFKRTVSWDVMEIPIKFHQHVTASIPLVHIFAVNQKPRLGELTHAVFRRFVFINFKKTLRPEEQDRTMLQQLLTEKDLLATLFLLGGIKTALEKRITTNKELLDQTILANNPVILFLYERFEPADHIDDETIQKIGELRKEFNRWYENNLFRSNDSFQTALENALEYLREIDERWGAVQIVADTKNSREIKKRMYSVVFPLKRLEEG